MGLYIRFTVKGLPTRGQRHETNAIVNQHDFPNDSEHLDEGVTANHCDIRWL